MSGSQSALLGGGSLPIGGLLPMWGVSNNPTINGIEYLRSGVLKAYSAGYASLATAAPGLLANVATGQANAQWQAAQNTIRHNGTNYYIFGGAAPYYLTALNSAITPLTGDTTASCYDAIKFGGYIIHCTQSAATAYSIFGGAGTAITLTAGQSYKCGAVNAAGTLGILVAGLAATAGLVYTGTNGAYNYWSPATPSPGFAGVYPTHAVWQPVSSTFALLEPNAHVFTTSNGVAYTDRGVATGLPAGVYPVTSGSYAASSYSAATAAATLFSCTTGTVSYLVRSTDGINFAAVTWASVLGFEPAAAPKISTDGTTFVAVTDTPRSSDAPGSVLHQSTDGGLTWTRMPVPVNPSSLAAAQAIGNISYINGAWVVQYTAPASYAPFTVASLSPTHIGMPLESNSPTTSGSTVTNYVRIK